jgi:hypothetical protein
MFDPTINDAFREYADLQLRHHQLLAQAMEDAPETSAIEDRMEDLWETLDEFQRRDLAGMGSDLNWVRRGLKPPPNGRKTPGEVSANEQQDLAAAIDSKDWHKVLHYLRLCAPAVPPASLAQARGRAYQAVGLPAYASVFFEQGTKIESRNSALGTGAPSRIDKTDAANAHEPKTTS